MKQSDDISIWRARLEANAASVRECVSVAARRSGRTAQDVRVVAVVKSIDAAVIPAFSAAGFHDLAENRVQQLVRRAGQWGAARQTLAETDCAVIPDRTTAPPCWHMIGHLQRNKVKMLLEVCRIVHGVDSASLAHEISARAANAGVLVDFLLEINVSGEASKFGLAPADAERVAAEVSGLPAARLRGLMTMAPLDQDAEAARPYFARLRELRDELLRRGVMSPAARELSMGMTHDYSVAIEEGATIVRVGTALCDGLPAAHNDSP